MAKYNLNEELKAREAAKGRSTQNGEVHLDDVSRVKVLSPGRKVFKRFIRNRLAVFGSILLITMFVFSFIGPLFYAYGQKQIFYKYDKQNVNYALAKENTAYNGYSLDDSVTLDRTIVNAMNSNIKKMIAADRDKLDGIEDEMGFEINKLADEIYTLSAADAELVASVGVMVSLLVAVLNLAKRVYEIIFLYIVMPVSMSTLPLDDGARFKVWRESFITKIVLAYGAVFSVNVFILLLPVITKMKIDGISGFGNGLFLIFMIIGGAMMIPAGQHLFARLFGQADDMHAGGGFLRSAFYGGRIASAMTIGAATKLIRGASHAAHHHKGKGDSGSKNDSNEKYVEEKSESTDKEGLTV